MQRPGAARQLATWTVVLLAAAIPLAAGAQGFAALVSPPRFELTLTAGSSTRQIIEITNGAGAPARYRFRTADWSLTSDGQVAIKDELQTDSCRPWVAIERNLAEVPAGGRLRYRFEVTVPPGTPAGECRFAVLIEGDDAAVASGEGFKLPVRGRIAIVVYVAVGDAAPRLEVVRTGTVTQNGQRLPAVFMRNIGNAHGRLSGFLSGEDASGRRLDFYPSSIPIMPGETRAIALSASDDREKPIAAEFPMTVRGTLEWTGGRLPFEQRFE